MKRPLTLAILVAGLGLISSLVFAQSVLFDFAPEGAPGSVRLSWPSVSGKTHDLWQSADLVNWTRADGFPLVGDGGMMEHVTTLTERMFYQVSTNPDGFVFIPAGNFQMGDTFSEGGSHERPVHTVYVSAFYMDKYEVTKALWDEVATWAASNGYDISASSASGKTPNHPAYYVTWYEAVKWCNARSQKEGLTPCYTRSWEVNNPVYKTGNFIAVCNFNANGYRLPTEAEWEKAARGGLSGKRFPWGDTITHDHANYRANGSAYSYDTSPYTSDTYHPDWDDGVWPYNYTSPVGTFAANGYGLYDMAGNVWEWCHDYYSSSYYSTSPSSNPRGPGAGTYVVIRGGSWSLNAFYCRAAHRHNNFLPGYDFNYLGFRSVRSSVP